VIFWVNWSTVINLSSELFAPVKRLFKSVRALIGLLMLHKLFNLLIWTKSSDVLPWLLSVGCVPCVFVRTRFRRKIVRARRIPPTITIHCRALDPRFTLAEKKIAVRRWSGLVGSANYFPPNSSPDALSRGRGCGVFQFGVVGFGSFTACVFFFLFSQSLSLGRGAGTYFSFLAFRFLRSWAASSFFWYSGHFILLAV
jgi:hypothetical protein